MVLNVRLDLPADVAEKIRRETPDLDADVTQAYVLELFRQGKVSHLDLSTILGLDRIQTDAFLKQHNVFEGSPTMADLEADRQMLDRVMNKAE